MQRPLAAPGAGSSVADWLQWQEALNPVGIELGLARVRQVAGQLGIDRQNFKAVLVAGTNGKGSTVAYLSALFEAAGGRVASYTSPFLERFNESLCIAGEQVSDDELVEAFEVVERARAAIDAEPRLTWFEFRTLACVWLIQRAKVDVAILEIGLGGRLDAVNVFEPEVSVITTIGLDHEAYLGNSIAAIAREKAGVMRPAKPTVLGDRSALGELQACADALGARLILPGRDYGFEAMADGGLRFSCAGKSALDVQTLAMDAEYQRRNAACALATANLMPAGLRPEPAAAARALASVQVVGRLQLARSEPWLLFDVAHNPQAAESLAYELEKLRNELPFDGRIVAVLGIYRDKNIEAIGAALADVLDFCAAVSLPSQRSETAGDLAKRLQAGAQGAFAVESFDGMELALEVARRAAGRHGLVVFAGSFETVRLAQQLASISEALETGNSWSSGRGPEFG